MWIYYLIPIIIHLIFLPLLFFERNGEMSLVESIVGVIVVPVYLVIVSCKFLDNFSISKFLGMLLIMLVVAILGIAISYFNWGITTGDLLKPDSETIYIIHWQIRIASIIVIIGWAVSYMIKYLIYKS